MLPKKRRYVLKTLILIIISIIIFYILKNVQLRTEHTRQLERTSREIIIENNYQGTTYYISSNGNSSSGTEEAEPMSLETAKTKDYKDGDKILFKCGDTFFGQATFNISATADNPVLISSYGEGEKPIISVSKIITNDNVWEKYTNDIYKVDLTDNNNFEGYSGTDDNSCNIGFFTTKDGKIYGNRQNSIENMNDLYDFYCDGQYFYIKSNQNPTDFLGTIKLSTKKDILALSNNTEISNLQLEYSSAHGIIKRDYSLSNVYIHDCTINNIGGSYQYGNNSGDFTRYGNAIEFWNGANNIIISNNLIKNVYDAGITLQGSTDSWNNISIRNNIIINACYSFELWASENSKGMNNIEIYNNITINQGKGWAQEVRPNPYNSANYVFYSYGEDANMDINIHDNKYYNSERLYYILYSTKDRFTTEVNNNNNIFYIQNGTYAVNSEQYNSLEEYLHTEYNTDQNSTFNYLSDAEINEISNPDILNSNNYEEIKAYYDNFDIKYRNNKWKEAVLTELETIINQEDYAVILQNTEIEMAYEELKNAIDNLTKNVDTITVNNVSYSHECLYKFIEKIVDEYYNNNALNIAENELIALIEKLDNLSDQYKEIYSYYITEDNVEIETVKNKINDTIDKYNNNLDLDIASLESIITTSKNIYNNYITTDNIYENLLNKNRIIYITNIVDNIIDNKINKFVEDEKSKIQVEFNQDINEPTNENITATLIVGNNTTIINNGGSNTYTFYENGTFDFELEIKGVKFTVAITIANINKEYKIENGYISNISKNTLAETLSNELNISNYKITHNGKELNLSKDVISTGDILTYDNKEYTLIVSGDINKDGDCGIHDLVSFRKYLLEYSTYDNLEEMAADTNQDNSLDIKDLVGIRKIILN